MDVTANQRAGSAPFDDGSWLARSSYCVPCGRWIAGETEQDGHQGQDGQDGQDARHATVDLPPRLWIYTNYDCNLACTYCVVSSSPRAERRAIGLDQVLRLLAEARALGVREIFFTGGEPFIRPDIYPMIAAATPHFRTTVLTNALLLRGRRLERLRAVDHADLRIQVSLDDSEPGAHDLYRGPGSWRRAVEGIRLLRAAGLRVRIASTVTPEGLTRLPALRAFVRDVLGVADEDHVVRPLVRRGAASAGLEIERSGLVPEITADLNGVYWHPVGTDADLLVTSDLFPLRAAIERIAEQMAAPEPAGGRPFR